MPTELRRMTPLLRLVLLASILLGLLASGCTPGRRVPAPADKPSPPARPAEPAGGSTESRVSPNGAAPRTAYAVGMRTLDLNNGAARPLRTVIYYPATASGTPGRPRAGAQPAAGRFPIVVFSHGLTGLPVVYQDLLVRWAAAGIVVVAPTYPHTSFGAPEFDALDVVNQPADASAVLTAVLALNSTPGDPLYRRLETARLAAAGHSAGGITTVGLFTKHRDVRLRAGIVLAGNDIGMGNVYSGPRASLLFIHGQKDSVVSYASGRAAYQRVPWSKALFTMPDEGHFDPYLRPGSAAYSTVVAMTTDFLRWTLYGDQTARKRIPADAGRVGTVEDLL